MSLTARMVECIDWTGVCIQFICLFSEFSGTCVIGDSCFIYGVDLLSIMLVELILERYKYLLGTY